MKKIEFNQENVSKDEVDKIVRKVRGVVINEKGQCLCSNYAQIYMLIGGKIEAGETEKETLKRELEEESGILLTEDELNMATPFLKIRSFDKNYFDRVEQRKLTRLTETTFYEVHTKSDINIENMHLTASEKEKEYKCAFMNLSVIPYLVQTNISNNPKKPQFDREILTTLREYASYKSKEKEIGEK